MQVLTNEHDLKLISDTSRSFQTITHFVALLEWSLNIWRNRGVSFINFQGMFDGTLARMSIM